MSDPLTTAVRNLATTMAQNDAAEALGLHVDEQYQAQVDRSLDDLIPFVDLFTETLGAVEYARERLAQMFAAEPDKSAALLAAALVRLAGAR